jgi:hypothetical protein
MRGAALVWALALPLAACAAAAPREEGGPRPSYNRRELPPEPGLFTGPDGVWTIYRNDEDEPAGGGRRVIVDDPDEGPGPR